MINENKVIIKLAHCLLLLLLMIWDMFKFIVTINTIQQAL